MSDMGFSSMGMIAFDIEHEAEEPTPWEILTALRRRYAAIESLPLPEIYEAVEVQDTYHLEGGEDADGQDADRSGDGHDAGGHAHRA